MNFEETLQYLFSLGHETLTIKLGLRTTELLLGKLGNPQTAFQSVQIAGTNGKGSTAVMLDSICHAAGIKTGLYTSPHLISITERIKISGVEISAAGFGIYATQVREIAEDLLRTGQIATTPTFFEQVTVIALLAFRAAGVELAILETGMGGRLDSTTVAGAQTVAITPLALDHQEYLGATLEEIAFEKAAIIRPGVTAIVAPQPDRAFEVIQRRAVECGVEPIVIDPENAKVENVTDDGQAIVTFDTGSTRYEKLRLGLRGRHQVMNASVAIQLAQSLRERGFEVSEAAIREGIEQARHEGRLELRQGNPPILFDGAHNPSGAQALREFLDEFIKRPLTILFGVMNDKNLHEIGRILFPAADQLVLTQPNNPRAAGIDKLREMATNILDSNKVLTAASPLEALRSAKALTPADGIICVTGSLYLIGDLKAQLNADRISKAAD